VGRKLLYFIVTALLLPLAINVATGGSVRPWTDPIWVALVLLMALGIALAPWQKVTAGSGAVGRRFDRRNRRNVLKQVDRSVRRRLEHSLSNVAKIELGLETAPIYIAWPSELVPDPDENDVTSLTSDDIAQWVVRQSESVLILGEPGSGKTTLLLELARDLIDRARHESHRPIPVVVELATWTEAASGLSLSPIRGIGRRSDHDGEGRIQRLLRVKDRTPASFEEWLAGELHRLYGVPVEQGLRWLRRDDLLIVLDGLDEVARGSRERCVDQINKFRVEFNLPRMAISCRIADYDQLRNRLSIPRAVSIKALERKQIEEALRSAPERLHGVRDALSQDPVLWELLDTPLMLNIMALAFHDRPSKEIQLGQDLEQMRKTLFDAYVAEVLARRQRPSSKYTPEQTTRWLTQLAICARAPGNGFPLISYRTVPWWSMSWRRAMQPSLGHSAVLAYLPMAIGGVVVGVVGGITSLFGLVAGAACGSLIILTSVVLVGYITATPEDGQKTPLSVYVRGLVTGAVLGGLVWALTIQGDRLLGLSDRALRITTGIGLVIALIILVVLVEARLPLWLVETSWWFVFLGGFSLLILAQVIDAEPADLERALVGGLVSAFSSFTLLLIAIQATDISDEVRWHGLRNAAGLVVVGLAASWLALLWLDVFGVVPPDGSALAGALFYMAGAALGMVAALAMVQLVAPWLISFSRVFMMVGALPWKLKRFLDHAADRNLLYLDRTGYRFVHALLQDHFLAMSTYGGTLLADETAIRDKPWEPNGDSGTSSNRRVRHWFRRKEPKVIDGEPPQDETANS
jgi:energy-coupling factor transporter ATP-binding protein EcfA2